jgi:pimeloyl-ACP methyl ester carboxylesterase
MPKIQIRSGIHLYYELHGDGFPLILIAGTGSHCRKWTLFQTPFFSQHYRVLIYDHRGTGRSDHPDHDYTIPMFAQDLSELTDALGIREAYVLGHSMGGQVAQQFAIDYPDKVRKLVLASTGSGFFEGYSFTRGIPLGQCLEFVEVGGSVAERERRSHWGEFWYTPRFRQEHADIVEKIIELTTLDAPPLKSYLRHIIARQNHQTTEQLHRIKVPTLIIVGSEDYYAPGTGNFVKQCRHLATRIPNSKLVLIPGARHGIFWEKADEVNQLIYNWLEEG